MPRLRTRNRSALAAATLLIVALAAGLSGCAAAEEDPLRVPTKTTAQTPEPTVTLTPIPSSSTTPGEDPEADVAAAIETYEAYIEASNKLVLADETTWEPVFALLQDPVLSADREIYEQMARDDYTFDGDAKVVTVEMSDQSETLIRLHACVDMSATRTLDGDGDSVGSANDEPIKSINVLLQANPDGERGWLIGHFGQSELSCK